MTSMNKQYKNLQKSSKNAINKNPYFEFITKKILVEIIDIHLKPNLDGISICGFKIYL
jgi:hypothetical protein